MTRPELRVYLDTWFCGCGEPREAATALLRLLRLHPQHDQANQDQLAAWLPDLGVRQLLLYKLDHDRLAEHGSSVDTAWLTEKGEAVLEALAVEEADYFETLLFSQYCAHGIDLDDECAACGPRTME